MVISKRHIQKRFSKATKSYNQAAQAQQMIVNQLFSMLPESIAQHSPLRVLEVGCGSGLLTNLLSNKIAFTHYTANDLSGTWREEIERILYNHPHEFHEGDAETFTFSQPFELITSSSALQWFHDAPQFIATAYKALAPNGVLLLSTFYQDNFVEIKSITGKGLNYPSAQQLVAHLPASANVAWHQQHIELYFPSPQMVLKHIQQTGTGATNDATWNKLAYSNFITQYEQFRSEQGYRLTYHPLYIKVIKTE